MDDSTSHPGGGPVPSSGATQSSVAASASNLTSAASSAASSAAGSMFGFMKRAQMAAMQSLNRIEERQSGQQQAGTTSSTNNPIMSSQATQGSKDPDTLGGGETNVNATPAGSVASGSAPASKTNGANSSYSMSGFMKRAQDAAKVLVKEGSVKAGELKRMAMETADMDALQRRLPSMETKYLFGTVDPATLNFTYITPKIVAMGFPGGGGSQSRHNPIDAVAKLLKDNHKGKFMIWNLSEEPYDYSKFDEQVLEFKFPGHPAPPLGMLFRICSSIESWVSADPDNVAVLHCLTGKGRTSTVISCLLSWLGQCESPMEALQYVSEKRGSSIEALTIPSQRRYIQYFTNMMDGVKPNSSALLLRRVIINSIPTFAKRTRRELVDGVEQVVEESKGCCPYLQIFKAGRLVYTSTWSSAQTGKFSGPLSPSVSQDPSPAPSESQGGSVGVSWVGEDEGCVTFPVDAVLHGDVLIRCRHLAESGHRVSMFRAAFHTGYIPMGILRLTKAQLDGACQDDRFPQDFFVDLIFAPVVRDEDTDSVHKNEESKVGSPIGVNRTESLSIRQEDKDAYDDMLHRDERFWEDINARQERRKKEQDKKLKPQTKLTPSSGTFSILSGDEENLHVEFEKAFEAAAEQSRSSSGRDLVGDAVNDAAPHRGKGAAGGAQNGSDRDSSKSGSASFDSGAENEEHGDDELLQQLQSLTTTDQSKQRKKSLSVKNSPSGRKSSTSSKNNKSNNKDAKQGSKGQKSEPTPRMTEQFKKEVDAEDSRAGTDSPRGGGAEASKGSKKNKGSEKKGNDTNDRNKSENKNNTENKKNSDSQKVATAAKADVAEASKAKVNREDNDTNASNSDTDQSKEQTAKKKEEEKGIDQELAELAALEAELGLGSLSTEGNDADGLGLSTGDDGADDNFDELEEYLKNLSDK